MNKVGLDSSAVIALLLNEKGAEKVSGYEGYTAMSTIDLAEICIRLVEIGVTEERSSTKFIVHTHPNISI